MKAAPKPHGLVRGVRVDQRGGGHRVHWRFSRGGRRGGNAQHDGHLEHESHGRLAASVKGLADARRARSSATNHAAGPRFLLYFRPLASIMNARRGVCAMVTAIVALKVDRKRVNEVAAQLAELPAVSEVYSVSGPYDLMAMVRTRDSEALADAVTGTMLKIDGILDSETMLAFRAYSRHDLEAMFSIGSR
jgi:DNA-binding Lrp family transcriptional regulator